MSLQVSLFGKFQVLYCDQIVAGLDTQKVQELFSYLLLHQNHPMSRETLAGLLWGDSSTVQSKKYLRQALWQLRVALDSLDEALSDRVLGVETNWICLNPKSDLWLDVVVFEKGYSLVNDASAEVLDGRQLQTLENTVRLYHGDLLEGWYQDWCLYERERLQNIYLTLLDKLMAYCELHGKYAEGLLHGAAILRYDRAHESTHRRLMRLHHLAGDRTAALRQYMRCVEALDKELSVSPSERTIRLYQQIRDDHLLDSTPAETPSHDLPERTTASVLELLSHLKQLQAALASVHHRMERDIQVIEHTLNKDH